MKTSGGLEVQHHELLTSSLDGDEWLASRPSRFTPGVGSPETHCIGGSVVPKAGLDAVVKRKKSHQCPCRELNPCRLHSHWGTAASQTRINVGETETTWWKDLVVVVYIPWGRVKSSLFDITAIQ